MRLLLVAHMALVTLYLDAQTYERVVTPTEEYFLYPFEDSACFDVQFPDGRWKIFEDNDTNKSLLFVFHLENNKVHGSFFRQRKSYFEFGNYCQDSVWTFLTDDEDTTFKVGEWLEYLPGLDLWPDAKYKIPYNENGYYIQEYINPNGRLRSRTIYQKGIGVKKVEKWDYHSGALILYAYHTADNSVGFRYSHDSLVFVGFSQGAIQVQNSFNNYMFVPGALNIDVSSSSSDDDMEIPRTIIDATIDEEHQLESTSFYGSQSRVEFEDGFMIIEYRNRRGRWKTKRIRIEKTKSVD